MQSALGAINDREIRSYILAGVATMLFRRSAVESGLQAARISQEGTNQQRFLLSAANELIGKNDFKGARILINAVYKDVAVSGDFQARIQQLVDVADAQARLGLFRQARLSCPTLNLAELLCYSDILWQYKARQNPAFALKLKEHESRYSVEW